MKVDEFARTRHELRQHLETKWTRDMRAQIAFPFLDDEVGLVHELEGKNLIAELGALAGNAVASHERIDYIADQRVAATVSVQYLRAAVR